MVDPEKYDIKDYVYIKIIEECRKYTEPEEKVNYLKYILYKWENNPPRLDLNGTLIPPFEVRIKNKIQRLEMGIEEREKGKWNGQVLRESLVSLLMSSIWLLVIIIQLESGIG